MPKTKLVANKTKKKAAPVGRPPFVVTLEICKKAERLAAQGLAEYQIADVLGINSDTLLEKKKEYSEFSEAIRVGKSKGVATIANALFKNAEGGDTVAQKYYLNNRDNVNWNERKDINIKSPEGVVLNMNYGEKK